VGERGQREEGKEGGQSLLGERKGLWVTYGQDSGRMMVISPKYALPSRALNRNWEEVCREA
jgi:hypothetical protein